MRSTRIALPSTFVPPGSSALSALLTMAQRARNGAKSLAAAMTVVTMAALAVVAVVAVAAAMMTVMRVLVAAAAAAEVRRTRGRPRRHGWCGGKSPRRPRFVEASHGKWLKALRRVQRRRRGLTRTGRSNEEKGESHEEEE